MATAAGGATGCYKCGRPGHWSRDCPSQPASQNAPPAGASAGAAPSPSGANQGNGSIVTQGGTQRYTQGGTQGYKRKEPWGERSGSFVPREKPVKTPAPPRRMPKLTPDLLLGADGLGYVLEKIPRQVTIKGRGHEVEDLKSLLEAYVRWHQTLLPYYSYSQFVEKVEKVGSTKRVRMCVRDLRSKIERGEKPTSSDIESGFQSDGAPDTRWEEDHDSDAAEDHGDPPMDVVEAHLRETTSVPTAVPASTQAESAPTSSSKPTLVIGEELITASQQEIKEDQRARMEANKQKALERARARKLELEKAAGTSTSPA
ncbi:hypothetical protein M758_3G258400 [Ceratodon purpureus]|uniref:CCHC-type domain-containing protein n=1 Tax=Ceratodon purpureus TaxID=3225 RepID=A0A8T0IR48_CERPU|nr:hypothetical protein KC19_3G258000 [Ceratodon purpureus]KAG0624584.1 hypothetical protein M758_3G258400 [Ceratodon purpureus]